MHQWFQNIGEILKFPAFLYSLMTFAFVFMYHPTKKHVNLQLFESFLIFHQTRIDNH